MNRAIEKAEELGHNYIGSEHVLYGLIAEGSGVAFNVLNKLGITADGRDAERCNQNDDQKDLRHQALLLFSNMPHSSCSFQKTVKRFALRFGKASAATPPSCFASTTFSDL